MDLDVAERLTERLKTLKVPTYPTEKTIYEGPWLIAQTQTDLNSVNYDIEDEAILLSTIKAEEERTVNEEVDGEGKYPPHLSTVDKRKAEAKKRLQDNDEYVKIREHLRGLNRKKDRLTVDLDLAKNLWTRAKIVERQKIGGV